MESKLFIIPPEALPEYIELNQGCGFLHTLLDSLPMAVLVYDVRLQKTIWVNRKAFEILRLETICNLNHLIESLQSIPDDMIKFYFDTSEFICNRKKTVQGVVRVKQKMGKHQYVYAAFHALDFNQDGTPKTIVGTGFDLTEPILEKATFNEIIKENKNLCQELILRVLTKREIEIMRYIAIGKTDKDIAIQLNVSFHTIRTHRRSIYEKTQVSNAAELVKIAFECGIV